MKLEDQLCFYRAYHFHPVNVAIHLIFIPIILFSSVTFLSHLNYSNYIPIETLTTNYGDLIDLKTVEFIKQYIFNVGTTLLISFSIFYIYLDHFNGFLFSSIILTVSYFLESLYNKYPANEILKYSISAHITAWIAQFIGHGFFEHRAPALLDNLVQALVLAPFFVFYELQFALGLNKQLKIEMDNKAAKLISEFRRQKLSSKKSQ